MKEVDDGDSSMLALVTRFLSNSLVNMKVAASLN